jgi:hypothetical protein
VGESSQVNCPKESCHSHLGGIRWAAKGNQRQLARKEIVLFEE